MTALKIKRTSISLYVSEMKHLTTNQPINQSINQFRLCSHYSGQLFVAPRKAVRYSVNSKGPGRHKSSTHIEHGAARLAERVWCTKSQSSLLNIYFRLSWFQSSLLLIHIRDRTNRCSHCTKVLRKIHSICNAPRSRSARRSFALSQKSRRHTVFVCERKPFPV